MLIQVCRDLRTVELSCSRLGLGGTARKDCEVKREELSSNDKLREQLLGRGYAKRHAEGKIRGVQKPLQRNSLQVEGKTRIIQPRRQANDSSEDEGGRSTLGKSKHRIPVIAGKQNIDSNNNAMGQADNVIPDEPTKPPRPPKRANCYLDEVLAERSRKKQKSKRKKHRVATELMTND